MSLKFCMVFILFLLYQYDVYAQQPDVAVDSVKVYKSIEQYAKKNKVSTFLYRLFFRSPSTSMENDTIKKKPKGYPIPKPYTSYEGKIIRNIYIETLDPFRNSVKDTVQASQNGIVKLGNAAHIKTQRIVIKNTLLFRENQTFDSLRVRESERLIRSKGFVQDVLFKIVETTPKSDSVDIYIRELDKWTIIPRMAFTTSQFNLVLVDRNFLGLGHEFQNGIAWYHTTGDNAYKTNYRVPNIRNTFIDANVFYSIDQYKNSSKSIAVDRVFYSPLTKWAGGLNVAQLFRNDSIISLTRLYEPQRFKNNLQDFWLGNAIQLQKGNTVNDRSTNFITTARYTRIRYLEFPIALKDPFHIYSDEDFYMGSVGISTRKYIQDKYIFKFGITEDIPIGKIVNLTSGYQIKNNVGRLYLSARLGYGNYFDWGYLSSSFAYGVFYRNQNPEQGTLIASAIYFTNLIVIGKWNFRHFIKPEITLGINRFPYDSLTLKEGNGIEGFSSSELTGTKRMLLSFQIQSYAPWNLIGFRFGPFINCTMGLLGNDYNGFSRSRLYSQIGLGVLIKNENLIINTFQFSFSFYPIIPGDGQNVIKVNSFRSTDFRLPNFEIGKPGSLEFQ